MPVIEPVKVRVRARARALGLVVAVIVVAVIVAGCTTAGPEQDLPPTPPETGVDEEAAPARRPITKPSRLSITNAALEGSVEQVDRAIQDLRAIGMWRRLTGDLYAVRFATRPGREQVPDDGHLADAYLTAEIDGRTGGSLCDVMFFPTAMSDDLSRWRTYHSQGLLADPPPTDRQFWASIMAHELAHCLDGGRGEGVAMRWERRALRRLRGAGVE